MRNFDRIHGLAPQVAGAPVSGRPLQQMQGGAKLEHACAGPQLMRVTGAKQQSAQLASLHAEGLVRRAARAGLKGGGQGSCIKAQSTSARGRSAHEKVVPTAGAVPKRVGVLDVVDDIGQVVGANAPVVRVGVGKRREVKKRRLPRVLGANRAIQKLLQELQSRWGGMGWVRVGVGWGGVEGDDLPSMTSQASRSAANHPTVVLAGRTGRAQCSSLSGKLSKWRRGLASRQSARYRTEGRAEEGCEGHVAWLDSGAEQCPAQPAGSQPPTLTAQRVFSSYM